MKFQIFFWEKDACGEIYLKEFMSECTIEGAYSEDFTREERSHIHIRQVPRAVITEAGNAEIVYDKQSIPADPSWFEAGTDHREEDGYYVRNYTIRRWFIEIETLEDLRSLAKKHDAEIGMTENPPSFEAWDY